MTSVMELFKQYDFDKLIRKISEHSIKKDLKAVI